MRSEVAQIVRNGRGLRGDSCAGQAKTKERGGGRERKMQEGNNQRTSQTAKENLGGNAKETGIGEGVIGYARCKD